MSERFSISTELVFYCVTVIYTHIVMSLSRNACRTQRQLGSVVKSLLSHGIQIAAICAMKRYMKSKIFAAVNDSFCKNFIVSLELACILLIVTCDGQTSGKILFYIFSNTGSCAPYAMRSHD